MSFIFSPIMARCNSIHHIMFKPLTEKDMADIAKLVLKELEGSLEDRELKLSVTDEALRYIAHEGYEPRYGARPLKRYIQKQVETGVAKLILSDVLSGGDTIEIGLEDGKLCCKRG